MKRLLLAGGGHAHLAVLRTLASRRLRAVDAILVTPNAQPIYSGMLPGWMAGHYGLAQCRIDLWPLAQSAGVQLVRGCIAGMDADRQCVVLADGARIDYDLLSLNIGSETDVSWLQAAEGHLLPVRPIDDFAQAWPIVLAEAADRPGYRLVVVGGGAAGIELAFAVRHAFVKHRVMAQVDLVAPEQGLLPGHMPDVAARVRRLLTVRGIALHLVHAAGTRDGLMLANGESMQADRIIAATGARAPSWLVLSGLALDPDGYVEVDSTHCSRSHRNIFAAGDVCARQDTVLARSGVHAMHAGPVLAHNLLAALEGGTLRSYIPAKCSLYLISTGPKYAIVSWGGWSAEGAWAWYWKDWIDRRFIRHHGGPLNSLNPRFQQRELPHGHEYR